MRFEFIESYRLPLTDHNDMVVGGYLSVVARLGHLAPGSAEAVGGPANMAAMRNFYAEAGEYKRAALFAESLEGMLSSILTVRHFERIAAENPGIRRPTSQVYRAGVGPAELLVEDALQHHSISLSLLRLAMVDDGDWVDLTGNYNLDVDGTCPIEGGPVRIDQREFAFEARRGALVLLLGAAGTTQVYALMNEPRFATIGVTADKRMQVHIPDQNAELLGGYYWPTEMTLKGLLRGDCTVTLRREL